MHKRELPSLKSPSILFLSFFGTGFFPYMPGTVGSIGILPVLYYFGIQKISVIFIIPPIIILSIVASIITDRVQKVRHEKDPSWIVIDEVLGMSVAWCFYPSGSLIHLFGIFLLFRFFDIFKFWPANFFDQKVTHGLGVIVDDLISGIYAGFTYLAILAAINYYS